MVPFAVDDSHLSDMASQLVVREFVSQSERHGWLSGTLKLREK